MDSNTENENSVLRYLNLSDEYERKARFFPAMLSIMLLLPAAFAIGLPLTGWIAMLISGTGASAVLAIGLSHLASAMGNRLQGNLWPDWPHDSPVNKRLHPNDDMCSEQQKRQWYQMIQDLTSLDIGNIEKDREKELKATINDAVAQIRNQLWKSTHGERLALHNIDYGFARNFTGFRIAWLPATTIGAIVAWVMFFRLNTELVWCAIATTVAILAYPLAYSILPQYVRKKADHYADSFFSALRALCESP